ncbi:hypothetical protein AAZV13_10G254600 [Glycine max]
MLGIQYKIILVSSSNSLSIWNCWFMTPILNAAKLAGHNLITCFALYWSGLSHWMQVWEPSVISLFQSLGNAFANTVWEELLESRSSFQVDLVPTGEIIPTLVLGHLN